MNDCSELCFFLCQGECILEAQLLMQILSKSFEECVFKLEEKPLCEQGGNLGGGDTLKVRSPCFKAQRRESGQNRQSVS